MKTLQELETLIQKVNNKSNFETLGDAPVYFTDNTVSRL